MRTANFRNEVDDTLKVILLFFILYLLHNVTQLCQFVFCAVFLDFGTFPGVFIAFSASAVASPVISVSTLVGAPSNFVFPLYFMLPLKLSRMRAYVIKYRTFA